MLGRHYTAQERVRGGWERLSLCVITGTDGEGHTEPSVHRGRPVQQSPVRHKRPECPRGGRAGGQQHVVWRTENKTKEFIASMSVIKLKSLEDKTRCKDTIFLNEFIGEICVRVAFY